MSNPYRTADGKFCSKDECGKSFANAIDTAIANNDTAQAEELKNEYKEIIMENDPGSKEGQEFLKEKYKTVPKRHKKPEKRTPQTIDKDFQNEMDVWRKKLTQKEYVALSGFNSIKSPRKDTEENLELYKNQVHVSLKSEENTPDYEGTKKSALEKIETVDRLIKSDPNMEKDFEEHKLKLSSLKKEKLGLPTKR